MQKKIQGLHIRVLSVTQEISNSDLAQQANMAQQTWLKQTQTWVGRSLKTSAYVLKQINQLLRKS